MKLLSLFSKKEILATKGVVENIKILSLSQKSDKKTESGLFFCINGISGDGHNYIKQAQENGCIALVVERWVDSSLPQILVRNTRNLLPIVCKRFYKNLLKLFIYQNLLYIGCGLTTRFIISGTKFTVKSFI